MQNSSNINNIMCPYLLRDFYDCCMQASVYRIRVGAKTRNREICCPYEVLNERREERKKGRKEEDKNREEISRREGIAHTQRWITGKRGRERKWKMT